MSRRVELLAPAGGEESVYAAVRCGADAVYIGFSDFSARQSAHNFTLEQLNNAIKYCHFHGVKLYIAANTIIFDSQLSAYTELVESTLRMGADAFIVQDMGAMRLIKNVSADAVLHASTQMTVHTVSGAEEVKKAGFSRVVLARELPLRTIADISKLDIETEVFVHGALCMSVSGQCLMSAMIGSRSANRGRCAQACRLPFSAVKGDDRCGLSLKDNCLIEHVDELVNAGVASLKIEGRMKRPEYVAAAVSAYRSAIDGKEYDIERLAAVFSRSGFTDGYFTAKTGASMFGSRTRDDVVAASDVLPDIAQTYRTEPPQYGVDMTFSLKPDKPAELTVHCEGISLTAYGEIPQRAISRPLTAEDAKKQLSKLGGTALFLNSFSCDIDDGLIIPVSKLNELRRSDSEQICEAITKKNTPLYSIDKQPTNAPDVRKRTSGIRVLAKKSVIPQSVAERADMVIFTPDKLECYSYLDNDKKCVMLPRFITDESLICDELDRASDAGVSHLYCENIAHISLGKAKGFTLHGGIGLNISNSVACNEYHSLGLSDIEASTELKFGMIKSLSSPVSVGISAYGRLLLMLTANCPLKAQSGCAKCNHVMYDRRGSAFPVYCSDGCSEIYNCDILWLADKKNELCCADFLTLRFLDESAQTVENVYHAYCDDKNHTSEKITRGLYLRGVE